MKTSHLHSDALLPQFNFWMSTRKHARRNAPSSVPDLGCNHNSAKEPSAAGRHRVPGFTKTVLSTKVLEAIPDIDGKMHTSGTVPEGKSKAVDRASQTCGGSRGTTGKRVRW